MKIDRIEIQTSNKKHATDIAMLVDKPEFLQEIQRLRSKWKVGKLQKLELPEPFSGVFSPLETKNLLCYTELDPNEWEEKLTEFNRDIEELLKKFKRGKNFKIIVEYALIAGIIPEPIYRSAYFDVVKVGEPESMENPERDQYVIVLSPRAELKEVKEAFREFKSHIKGKINFHTKTDLDIWKPGDKDIIEQFHKGNVYESANVAKFKTLKELDRTREWYWIAYHNYLNGDEKKRKPSEDILDEWQKENCPVKTEHKDDIEAKLKCPYCSVEDVNIIDQALSSYSKLLSFS